ncbi:dermatopontin-like [Physella acuta]|uniref:dermatopontin-like n=1 Tax=Physella acuta TaxID=109671 RepID=UPI0027DB497B|nr:dermatopontin-like [Physella acuta]
MYAVVFALCLVGALAERDDSDPDRGFVHEWREDFNFRCPSDQIINRLVSVHSSEKNDRRWRILCKSVSSGTRNCEMSEYANDFDEPLLYKCPSGKVLTGIKSDYDSRSKDRRYSFQCCKVRRSNPSDCKLSDWQNNFGEKLRYMVPDGWGIRGVYSFHKNKEEDRRWRFEACDLDSKCMRDDS